MKRFWNKVDKTDFCWNWVGGSRGNGYGCIKINKKTIDTHRFSWELHFGTIPEGMLVCHKCDNKRCVNPEHLYLADYKTNNRDARDRIIFAKKIYKCKPLPYSKLKLNKKKADEIRGKYKTGFYSYRILAKEFGVHFTHIRDIIKNERWA